MLRLSKPCSHAQKQRLRQIFLTTFDMISCCSVLFNQSLRLESDSLNSFFTSSCSNHLFCLLLNIQTDVDAGPPCSESCCNSPKKGAGIKKSSNVRNKYFLSFFLLSKKEKKEEKNEKVFLRSRLNQLNPEGRE